MDEKRDTRAGSAAALDADQACALAAEVFGGRAHAPRAARGRRPVEQEVDAVQLAGGGVRRRDARTGHRREGERQADCGRPQRADGGLRQDQGRRRREVADEFARAKPVDDEKSHFVEHLVGCLDLSRARLKRFNAHKQPRPWLQRCP